MIRFLADEDFNIHIIAGVRRRLPGLDIVRVQDVGLRTFSDPLILAYAAETNRLVLTHDVSTMEKHATARLKRGEAMPGLFKMNQNLPIGQAIDAIVTVAECSHAEEWKNIIQYLPL